MTTSSQLRLRSTGQRWRRAALLIISLGLVGLVVSALVPRFHDGRSPSLLFAFVLIALSLAVALHARFLLWARREHRETSGVLHMTEREFQSIFDSTLDAILILDDQDTCLEANPAALALLGIPRAELIGYSILNLFPTACEDSSPRFPSGQSGHGEMRLARSDGKIIFVEYGVKTNYLPRRHVAVLRDVSQRRRDETALRESDERFRQMADNIQEVYWMIEAETKNVAYVNQAFESVTGRSCETLRDNPASYQELFHPEDRTRILTRLEEAVKTGQFDEEFRIIRPDHATRWIAVRGFPVKDAKGTVRRMVGTAQDITARKSAEERMARSLALAESARAEADAFRNTTLALTQNLSMDNVLDTLLQSLLKLVPCESARVLLLETQSRLFLAREIECYHSAQRPLKCPGTWDATESKCLARALSTKTSLLIADTDQEDEWEGFKGNSQFGSWLCVPLIASDKVLGLLSLGDTRAHAFSQEHLRLAKSLAIPAAVAIQNARLYERAEIYGAELEQRLTDLGQTQGALRQAEQGRALLEERFAKVFRSSPIAFSITTLEEGLFIDVNEAFECSYGYPRGELLGRTVFDVGIWDDRDELVQMREEIREQGRVRNRIARFRKRSGEIVGKFYSADSLDFDGRLCILAVSENVPDPLAMPSSVSDEMFGC